MSEQLQDGPAPPTLARGPRLPSRWGIAASVVFVLAAIFAVTGVVDEAGERYSDGAMKRSLAAFAIARGINAVISAMQGTEIAMQPAGIGITLAPGELLDPVNDLVERFSWVMLASSISLGVHGVLLEVSRWSWLTAAMVLANLAAIVLLWLARGGHGAAAPRAMPAPATRRLLLGLAVALTCLRLAAPAFAWAGEVVYQQFLSERFGTAAAGLEVSLGEMRAIQASSDEAQAQHGDPSLWDRTKALYSSAADTIDLRARVDRFAEVAARATANVVDLVIVFVFQCVILPLLFLWLFYALLTRLPGLVGRWLVGAGSGAADRPPGVSAGDPPRPQER